MSESAGMQTKTNVFTTSFTTSVASKTKKRGTLDSAILPFPSIEQFVSFKRHLLACHSSLKHIVVKAISINNGIAGIDYFQIAVVLHNMILAAELR